MRQVSTNLEETLGFKNGGTERPASVTSLTGKFSVPSALLSHSSPHNGGSLPVMFAFYLREFYSWLTASTTRAGIASAALCFVLSTCCAPQGAGTLCMDLHQYDVKGRVGRSSCIRKWHSMGTLRHMGWRSVCQKQILRICCYTIFWCFKSACELRIFFYSSILGIQSGFIFFIRIS